MLVKYSLLLALLSYGIICSLLLFSRGFLLSRNIITSKSGCINKNYNVSEILNTRTNINSNRFDDAFQDCHFTRTKVIIIVIDALRYDFVVNVEKEHEKLYHNKFKFVQSLLKNENLSRLYKFVADPPTTTMQRLHGMMTGSLPTFIDIGSNFASSEIIEDNLLSQLRMNNKKVVFLGDDTWTSLFPDHFHRKYPYPSFDVWDLDTVDNGVKQNIYKEINYNDWDLLIAHFLGVDHCGHRFGPNHLEMKRKLLEMDAVIKNVVQIMDNNTMLFVFGDHGMTENGDHGGDSYEEITAGIFVYSPVGLNVKSKFSGNEINQIDLLPTLSTIFGIPIPFSNLGSIIIEFLPSLSFQSDLALPFKLILNNINQITNYIKVYNSINNYFPQDQFNSIINNYDKFKSQKFDENFTVEANIYLKSVQEMCRRVWTQFDFLSIIVSLFSFAIFLILTLLIHFDIFNLERLKIQSIIFYFFLVSSLFCIKSFVNFNDNDLLFYLLSCLGAIILIVRILSPRFLLKLLFYNLQDLSFNILSIMVFIFSFVGQLSNSFIIKENYVITFLLVTMILSVCFQISFYNKIIMFKIFTFKITVRSLTYVFSFVLCISLRLLAYFWQCYDDQSVECSSNKSSTILLTSFTLFVILAFYILAIFLPVKFHLKFGIFEQTKLVLLMLSLIFLIINSSLPLTNILLTSQNILPRIVCFVSLILIIFCFLCPQILIRTSLRPHNFIKTENDNCDSKIYLVVYFQISTLFWILSLVVLNDRKLFSSVIMFLSAPLLLILLGIRKVIKSKNHLGLLNVSFNDVVTWYLSSIVHFYGTGHQPTFPSLQWDAVGPFTSLPIFIPGLLITFNTFISQIIHSLFLPLLIIVPFIISDLSIFHSAVTLAETISLRNHKYRRRSLFALFILLIFLQGCRVFTIMLSAAIHSRHLMVWKIFAPKFIFEAVGFIVSLVFLLVSFVFVDKISCYFDDVTLKHYVKIR